ncbi:terminase large subunit domain-containing protein [Hyphococcus sp.]|uniref:terminase large subunit domain-containing protein n=1 Tax=Hyphococcus sp. TaxID=2038636 RepID=UPI0035C74848
MKNNTLIEQLDHSLNPLHIFEANLLNPLSFQASLMNLEWQGRPAPSWIVVASRRAGKSFSLAGLCAFRAIYHGEDVIVACPNESHARNFIRICTQLIFGAKIGSYVKPPKVLEIESKSGGRILAVHMARGGSAARGLSGHIVCAEEAVLVDNEAATEALLPILASASKPRFVAISSAGKKSGWLYDWFNDETDTETIRIQLSAYDVPHIDPVWLEKQRARMSPSAFAREYLAEFTDYAENPFIPPETLDRVFVPGESLHV